MVSSIVNKNQIVRAGRSKVILAKISFSGYTHPGEKGNAIPTDKVARLYVTSTEAFSGTFGPRSLTITICKNHLRHVILNNFLWR